MTARTDYPALAWTGGPLPSLPVWTTEARAALDEIDRLRQLVIEQWNTLAELAELAAIEAPS